MPRRNNYVDVISFSHCIFSPTTLSHRNAVNDDYTMTVGGVIDDDSGDCVVALIVPLSRRVSANCRVAGTVFVNRKRMQSKLGFFRVQRRASFHFADGVSASRARVGVSEA